MKELSIEEKAKRYDEAIKVAKGNYETIVQMDNDCTFAKEGIVNTFHHIFPELKESEGERVKKDIKRAVSVALDYSYFDKETANNCLAWLEKQDKKIDAIENFDTEFEKQISRLIASIINKDYKYTKDFVKWTSNALLNYAILEIEKNSMSISEATKQELEDNLNKALEKKTPESWNKFLEKQGEQKPTIEMITPEESLGVDSDTYNKIVDECIYGEQKPAWSEKDDINCKRLLYFLNGGNLMQDHKIELFIWMESLKERMQPQPKQEWKQENIGDLNDFENAMMHIGNSFFGQHAGLDPNNTNAIKEQANLLLELVPNKEWSKEDENNILFLTSIIEEYFKDKENITLCGDTNCANFTKENVINRLKSLRPQNTWKPSDLQIEALDSATENCAYSEYQDCLRELIWQLKKLREE